MKVARYVCAALVLQLGLSANSSADPLKGIDYECREAKLSHQQAFNDPAPWGVMGTEFVAWFEKHRNIEHRVKGRINFTEGRGVGSAGNFSIAARGGGNPEGLSFVEVRTTYVFSKSEGHIESYDAGASFALRPGEVGTISYADSDENNGHNLTFLCSFTPVK